MKDKTAVVIGIVGVWTMAAISGLSGAVAVAGVATVVLLSKKNKAYVELKKADKEVTLGKFK
jgi:hypothetical protein